MRADGEMSEWTGFERKSEPPRNPLVVRGKSAIDIAPLIRGLELATGSTVVWAVDRSPRKQVDLAVFAAPELAEATLEQVREVAAHWLDSVRHHSSRRHIDVRREHTLRVVFGECSELEVERRLLEAHYDRRRTMLAHGSFAYATKLVILTTGTDEERDATFLRDALELHEWEPRQVLIRPGVEAELRALSLSSTRDLERVRGLVGQDFTPVPQGEEPLEPKGLPLRQAGVVSVEGGSVELSDPTPGPCAILVLEYERVSGSGHSCRLGLRIVREGQLDRPLPHVGPAALRHPDGTIHPVLAGWSGAAVDGTWTTLDDSEAAVCQLQQLGRFAARPLDDRDLAWRAKVGGGWSDIGHARPAGRVRRRGREVELELEESALELSVDDRIALVTARREVGGLQEREFDLLVARVAGENRDVYVLDLELGSSLGREEVFLVQRLAKRLSRTEPEDESRIS